MAFLPLVAAILLSSCEKKDMRSLHDPIDLSDLLELYDNAKVDSTEMYEVFQDSVAIEMGNRPMTLLGGTKWQVDEVDYSDSECLFLAQAVDMYNARICMFDMLSDAGLWMVSAFDDNQYTDDNDIAQSLNSYDMSIIKTEKYRKPVENYRKHALAVLRSDIEWTDSVNFFAATHLDHQALNDNSFIWYEDKDSTEINRLGDKIAALDDSISNESYAALMKQEPAKRDRYFLQLLTSAKSFEEQCALSLRYANRINETDDADYLLMAVMQRLMDADIYYYRIYNLWRTWRVLYQTVWGGMSRESCICNDYYNAYRAKCFVTILKHIDQFPDDVIAYNEADMISGKTNIDRMGFDYGNTVMLEMYYTMPNRFGIE